MITATICTIGDEILIGQIVDTNSSNIAKRLNDIGVKVVSMVSCQDDENDIINNISSSLKRSEIVIVTGGLGPTKDDITKEALKKLSISKRYICSNEQLDIITNILSARGIEMLDINRQQAYVPDKCTVIPNRFGTAPIMQFRFGKKQFGRDNLLFSMPGVPFECLNALDDVICSINEHYKLESIFHKTICTFGLPESVLSKRIEDWECALDKNIHLAYLPNPILGVRLRLSVYGENQDIAQKLIASQIRKLKRILKEDIYSIGESSLQKELSMLLTKRKETLSVAESCTGGFISHLFTSIPGASKFFYGGVVSYDNSVKINTLHVKKKTIEKYGAVSQECVKEMAEGVRKELNTTYAIATSGIAGPTGGTKDKPSGTLWIAIAGPKQTLCKTIISKSTREVNIQRFASSALDFLRRNINRI